jgi:MarR family transcriptional regulator, lower aerobic nicotinate degradation pathway regulator
VVAHVHDTEVRVSEYGVVDHLSAPGHLLRRAQQVHTEVWSRLVADVTGPQYAVLVAVAGWPGLDQKRAGELASLDKSTTAGIVTRLVTGGWLNRVHDPNDRRRRLLELSSKGRDALAGITASARAVQKELLAPLPEGERDDFLEVLGRVARLGESDIGEQGTEHRTLVMARTPGYLIRRAQQLHTAYWNERVRDVTGPQYAVLAAVLTDGVATHAEIGLRASLDSSSTRDIVGRLIDSGWLEPVENARDRRSRPVRVTAPATTAIRLLREPVLDVQRHVLAPLEADDQVRFINWMRRVAGVDAVTDAGAPSATDQLA